MQKKSLYGTDMLEFSLALLKGKKKIILFYSEWIIIKKSISHKLFKVRNLKEL